MPQGLVTVYFTETGEKVDMHPIDANEAMATGLYTLEAPAPKATPPPANWAPASTPTPSPEQQGIPTPPTPPPTDPTVRRRQP